MKHKAILIILIFYLIIAIVLNIKNPLLYTILNSLYWLIMFITLKIYIKESYIKLKNNIDNIVIMLIISFVYIIIYIFMGFLIGFSNSPYSHQILKLLTNITPKIINTFGIEITRQILVLKNKNNKKMIILITILLTIAQINFNSLINTFSNKELLFKTICGNLIPLLASNILYTYLTIKTSYLVAVTNKLIKELIIFILPILPNADWFIAGTLGTLSSAVIYFIFKYKIFKEKSYKKKKLEKVDYITIFILLFTLICFMLGIFKYEPITILSNSMSPYFNRGDIVIFKKVKDSELAKMQKNTIIVYNTEGKNIVHRIVDKTQKNDNVLYKTKGDSNNIADIKLVQTNQIKGKYVFHIKYIGFPSIWLYEYFNKENKEEL